MSEIEQAHREFFQDVLQYAEAEDKLPSDVFFEHYTEWLMEAGEIPEANPAHYERRGIRVDGYGGAPISSGETTTLTLMLCDFQQDPGLQSLTRTEMDQMFNRLSGFVGRAIDPAFRLEMEETDPAFGLADMIAAEWDRISQIRFLILSNQRLSSRIDRMEADEIEGKPVSRSVWDFTRMHRLWVSGKARESMEIDLVNDFACPLPVLQAHIGEAGYASYVAVVPGALLAEIYGRWGDRLLEQNVRVFLQARSNVNRGIRNTLTNEPRMFFAYNNGITATAEKVELREGTTSLLELTSIHNFQIVNGGQTTGSIYAASRDKNLRDELASVFVQMKLSVIDPDQVDELVPKISRFANSQNSVNLADFSANHPFHVRIEAFSRRLLAPAEEGSLQESKWFYERARGQHQQQRAILAPTARRKFDLEYPKQQKFVKTDLAKFVNVWEQKPHKVSLGAQKNFADFSQMINERWDKNHEQFGEQHFRELIAMAIIFKGVEKMVASRPWYETGGYRAPIVAYTISKLAHDVQVIHKATVDFQKVWEEQAIGRQLMDALIISADAVKDVILNPAQSGYQNITEWAKFEACWTGVSSLKVDWPDSLPTVLISAKDKKKRDRLATKDQKQLSGIEAQKLVVEHPEYFAKVITWLEANPDVAVGPKDMMLVRRARDASTTGRVPEDWQCEHLLKVVQHLQDEGFPEELPG